MKTFATIFSSLVAGLVFGASPVGPMLELQNYFEHKRRFVWSLIFGATAFVFVLAAILFSAVEVALQLEDQGFLIWNAMLTLSVILVGVALVCAGIGKWLMPRAADRFGLSSAQQTRIMELLEDLVHRFFDGEPAQSSPSPQREEHEDRPQPGPDRSEVADYGQPEYTTH